MPQMSPMWWSSIMLMTTMFLLIIMMINYFTFNSKVETNSKKIIRKINWKW